MSLFKRSVDAAGVAYGGVFPRLPRGEGGYPFMVGQSYSRQHVYIALSDSAVYLTIEEAEELIEALIESIELQEQAEEKEQYQ